MAKTVLWRRTGGAGMVVAAAGGLALTALGIGEATGSWAPEPEEASGIVMVGGRSPSVSGSNETAASKTAVPSTSTDTGVAIEIAGPADDAAVVSTPPPIATTLTVAPTVTFVVPPATRPATGTTITPAPETIVTTPVLVPRKSVSPTSSATPGSVLAARPTKGKTRLSGEAKPPVVSSVSDVPRAPASAR